MSDYLTIVGTPSAEQLSQVKQQIKRWMNAAATQKNRQLKNGFQDHWQHLTNVADGTEWQAHLHFDDGLWSLAVYPVNDYRKVYNEAKDHFIIEPCSNYQDELFIDEETMRLMAPPWWIERMDEVYADFVYETHGIEM